MDTTWWADKTVQQDRAAFMAAVAVQQVRWDAEARFGAVIAQSPRPIPLMIWPMRLARRNGGYSLVVG